MSWLPQVAVGMLGLLCRIEKHVWRDWRRPVDEANNGREGARWRSETFRAGKRCRLAVVAKSRPAGDGAIRMRE